MTPATTPWAPDEGSPVIPDPEITLSEAINAMGALQHFLNSSRAEGDAVLASLFEKLRESAHALALEHPDEYDAVLLEVEMQKRFGLRG